MLQFIANCHWTSIVGWCNTNKRSSCYSSCKSWLSEYIYYLDWTAAIRSRPIKEGNLPLQLTCAYRPTLQTGAKLGRERAWNESRFAPSLHALSTSHCPKQRIPTSQTASQGSMVAEDKDHKNIFHVLYCLMRGIILPKRNS